MTLIESAVSSFCIKQKNLYNLRIQNWFLLFLTAKFNAESPLYMLALLFAPFSIRIWKIFSFPMFADLSSGVNPTKAKFQSFFQIYILIFTTYRHCPQHLCSRLFQSAAQQPCCTLWETSHVNNILFNVCAWMQNIFKTVDYVLR